MDNITLENEMLKVVIIPGRGGKVVSLRRKDLNFEFAAQTGGDIKPATDDSKFGDYDISGIDDAFPNIDCEKISYGGHLLSYPDHGEIWSHNMKIISTSSEAAALTFDSTRFGYHYEKTVEINNDILEVKYLIRNEGRNVLPCFWTFHGLFAFRKDAKIVYPSDVAFVKNVLNGTPLGDYGKVFPVNGTIDFSSLSYACINEPCMMKYYATNRIEEGTCGIIYPSDRAGIDITYDAMKLPWLGVWITAGGLAGDYNMALEMTNGYYDSISNAMKNKRILMMKPGEDIQFTISLHTITMPK